jgi:hypothetical protein
MEGFVWHIELVLLELLLSLKCSQTFVGKITGWTSEGSSEK